MKYLKYLFVICCLFLFFTGCEKNDSYLKELSYKELNDKIEAKEKFFFMITQDGCSHCENFIPVVEKVLNDKKVVGYNFNLSNLSDSDRDEFDKLFDVDGTPTTIFIENGTEVSLLQRINGEATEDKLIQKLKNNGYLE